MPYPKNKKLGRLLEILSQHRGRNLPFVLYRKPEHTHIRAVLQADAGLHTEVDLQQPGFLMVPFHPEETTPVFLKADQLFQAPAKRPRLNPLPASPISSPVAREIHLELVRKSVKALREGAMEKVVVSRRFSLPAPADPFEVFLEGVRWYPDSFAYLWHHPAVGTWMGVTPERFLRYHSGVAETLALAGTRIADPQQALPDWTEKERREQRLVTDFILDTLRAAGLKPQEGPLRNVRAGKLWHLGTTIRTFAKPEDAPGLLSALHPTPAVCGLPRETAYDFIRQCENYNREYYTGYLGEVCLEEEDSFECFVNLRCVQFRGGKAYVYVGGGITTESDPEAEWEEIQQKSTTVLSLLQNSP